MENETLAMWVVYVKGLEPYVKKHIARKFVIADGKTTPTLETETGNTLEEIRFIMLNKGLVCIGRDALDDSVIIETWI